MHAEYTGRMQPPWMTELLNLAYIKANLTYVFQLNSSVDLDAASAGNATRWINHADRHGEANCEAKIIRCGREFHVVLQATSNIKAGAELLYEYQMTGSVPLSLSQPHFAESHADVPAPLAAAVLHPLFPDIVR